jgi:hypothetical protein
MMETPVEIVVALEVMLGAWVAPESVTFHSSSLAGRVSRKRDRQCSKRDKCQLSQSFQLVHGDTSLSLPSHYFGWHHVTGDS